MTRRATFCYGDSHSADALQHRGAAGAWEDVLAQLLLDSFTRDGALGEAGLSPEPNHDDASCTM